MGQAKTPRQKEPSDDETYSVIQSTNDNNSKEVSVTLT